MDFMYFQKFIKNKQLNFFNQIIDKYYNFKIKPAGTKLLFKISLRDFEKKSFSIYKPTVHNIRKTYTYTFNFKNSIKNLKKLQINFKQQGKNIYYIENILKKFSTNQKIFIIKMEKNNSILVNFEKKYLKNYLKTDFLFTNSKDFKFNQNTNNYLYKTFLKLKSKISFYKENRFFNRFKYQSQGNFPLFINNYNQTIKKFTKSQYEEDKKSKIKEKSENTIGTHQKTYLRNLTKNYQNIYIRTLNQNKLKTNANFTGKEKIKYLNSKTEIKERKLKNTETLTNFHFKKEEKLKKIQNEIEKIKTEILIKKSDEVEKKEKTEVKKIVHTTKKETKEILAEEIYEIVLKKWEKDLIKRGLING